MGSRQAWRCRQQDRCPGTSRRRWHGRSMPTLSQSSAAVPISPIQCPVCGGRCLRKTTTRAPAVAVGGLSTQRSVQSRCRSTGPASIERQSRWRPTTLRESQCVWASSAAPPMGACLLSRRWRTSRWRLRRLSPAVSSSSERSTARKASGLALLHLSTPRSVCGSRASCDAHEWARACMPTRRWCR